MLRTLAFLPFLLIAVAILAGLHFYLWVRLVRDPGLAGPWRTALTLFLLLAALAIPAGMFLSRLLSFSRAARLLASAIYLWMGFAFLLFASLIATDLVRWLASAGIRLGEALRWLPERPADPGRRVFLARGIASGAVLAASSASAVGIWNATAPPRIHDVEVRLPRFPRELSGFTIAQITDLHVGPTIGEREVRQVVEQTNALRPDLVAITGDLVDASVDVLGPTIAQLTRLESRHGVYFVTGNHEYYAGPDEWVRELRRLGIRVLRNERVAIGEPGGPSFDLAGIDDWSSRRYGLGHGPDLERALAGRDPDRSLVLLAHQPWGVSEAVRSGVELQISGHTHGGQIFPFTLVVSAIYRYCRGLYTHREPDGREGQIFVSCGTGYWGPPIRLGAPAEIARIVLV